jgi:hypothetical protein
MATAPSWLAGAPPEVAALQLDLRLLSGRRIGESVTLPYRGHRFTAEDGTVWMATNGIPITYDPAEHQHLLPTGMCHRASVMPGPLNGRWYNLVHERIVGSTAPGATWLAVPNGSSSVYYTSTDSGATWTERSSPGGTAIRCVLWDGVRFVLYHQATTTAGAHESTDGISWTPRDVVSITTLFEFAWNGSVYLATGDNVFATSTDRITWTSRTGPTGTGILSSESQGFGALSWNAGAGLWLASGPTSGALYSTAPSAGDTWTSRTGIATALSISGTPGAIRFASSATRTVATVPLRPSVCVSDDCISWTVVDLPYDVSLSETGGARIYYDSDLFVLFHPSTGGLLVFLSEDGLTWSRGPLLPSVSYWLTPDSRLGFRALSASGIHMRHERMSSTSTPSIVLPIATHTQDSASRAYVRIA